MKELYLNNQLCDIDGDFNPTFQFRSFLFARMQGYDAARTWEVSIPLTARNRNIISQAQAVDNVTSFPYTTHTVSYYSDGYPIVEAGRAYMVGTTAGRALFVFVLGETLPVLKSLSEVKLRELDELSTDWFAWNPSMNFNDMSSGFGWCNFFSFTNQDRTLTGTNSDIPYATLHPTVTLNYIMNKIQAFFGITIVGFGTLLNGCAFPLKDSDGVSIIESGATSTADAPAGFAGGASFVTFETFSSDYFELQGDKYFITYNKKSVQVHITNFRAAYTTATGTVTLKITDLNGNTRTIATAIESVSGSITRYDFVDYTFDFDTTDSFFFFERAGTGGYAGATFEFEVLSNIAFYSPVTPGGFFPVIPNLPDMTCADFINQCCMITGLFPYVNPATPTVLNFYSAKVLSDNAPAAQNWSRYLIKSTDTMGEAEDMKHQLDGFAQNNRMRYADDPTNLLDTSGNLTVANTNIEKESELLKLTFAAGKRVSATNTIIDYPLYDVSVVDGALVRNKINQSLTPLGFIVNSGGVNYLTFPDALKFSALQSSTAYLYYQAYIYRPHVLRERFTLSARLTSLIDVRIPIYLEQYGKYYAIMEAQVDGDYNADVTLLEV